MDKYQLHRISMLYITDKYYFSSLFSNNKNAIIYKTVESKVYEKLDE